MPEERKENEIATPKTHILTGLVQQVPAVARLGRGKTQTAAEREESQKFSDNYYKSIGLSSVHDKTLSTLMEGNVPDGPEERTVVTLCGYVAVVMLG